MQTFIHIFIPNFKFMKFIYFSHSSPPPPRPRMGRQKARTFHNKQQYFWRSFAGDEAEFSGTLSYCLKNESVEELREKLASNCYCWVIPPESGEELLVNHVPKRGWLCKQSWWIRGDYKATIRCITFLSNDSLERRTSERVGREIGSDSGATYNLHK